MQGSCTCLYFLMIPREGPRKAFMFPCAAFYTHKMKQPEKAVFVRLRACEVIRRQQKASPAAIGAMRPGDLWGIS